MRYEIVVSTSVEAKDFPEGKQYREYPNKADATADLAELLASAVNRGDIVREYKFGRMLEYNARGNVVTIEILILDTSSPYFELNPMTLAERLSVSQ